MIDIQIVSPSGKYSEGGCANLTMLFVMMCGFLAQPESFGAFRAFARMVAMSDGDGTAPVPEIRGWFEGLEPGHLALILDDLEVMERYG